ncbi:uncharacterized protein [Drosophila tropicalis]|uniref:uncharacterized protein n=1 Tax=Drosophila tropicalis TaxID=46794 RepID=UPI0035AB7742
MEREERRETITIAPVTSLPSCLTYRQIQGTGFGAVGSAPAKRVPVLFSTNCGLYLRLAQPAMHDQEISGNNQRYNITFCDLERWSTNRANVVSLEDTFNIISPENQHHLWNNYPSHNHQFKYDLEHN